MAKRIQTTRQLAVNTPLDEDVLLLQRMVCSEEIGRPYEIDLTLLSDKHDIPFKDVVGTNFAVRLELAGRDTPRFFNGYVSRFVQTGEGGGMTEYRATLVPWLWFLTRRADCRIFQKKTVPDIVKQVFRDAGYSDFEDKLDGTYREWEYCVQYRETDFNFVSRLMEQEGIYYYFRHEEQKHVLVLADSTPSIKVFPGYETIRFKPRDAVLTDREFIHTWEVERQLQPGAFAHTDYDFKAPKKDLFSAAKATRDGASNSFEVFDYPGEFTVASDGEDMASVRLDEYQTRFEVARGTSDSRGIAVGCKFKLEDFRRADQNKNHLVVSSVIEATSDEFESGGQGGEEGAIVEVSFTAIDATQLYRTPRVTPKPVVHGCQTAFVVGKKGEEIWTDEHGRVMVQFHWDRDSEGDENTSCFIRVSQPWAGKGWGAINVPRIGQEVIVEFLEGDPDQPIITGRVYNGENKPPYALPGEATKTTLKTNTSKGGGGFNELRFEDKKDEEQVFVHGQKDLDARVKNDTKEWVGHDRHLVVVNHQFEKITGDRHEIVEANHYEQVTADRHLNIDGNEIKYIATKQSLKVADDAAEEFGKNRSTKVTEQLSVKAKVIVLEAEENITLKVGQAFIAIEKDCIKIAVGDGNGKIELDTKGEVSIKSVKDTKIEATGNFEAKGTAGATLESAATGTVKAGGPLTVQGATVSIN